MTRRRIVALTTSFPLHEDSWPGIFIERLYENLEGWQLEVVCPDDDADTPPPSRRSGSMRVVPVRYAPKRWQRLAQQSGGVVPGLRRNPFRILLLPILLASMTASCAKRARDAILIHANWVICGVIAILVGQVFGKPVICTLRGDDVTRARTSAIERRMLSFVVERSHGVICVSQAVADDLRLRFPNASQRIHVSHNGVDASFLNAPRRVRDPSILCLGAIGSMVHRKGFDVLLGAVAAANNRERIRLRIVGSGPERSRLEGLVQELKLQAQVDFIGELNPVQIPTFFSTVDVFVLSSRSEGRPNVVIEALAAGVPVITTDIPGVHGLVDDGQTGWVVPIDDTESMANAMDEAFDDIDTLSARSVAARSRMAEGHGWAATAAVYEYVFNQAIGSTRSRLA